MRTFPAVLIGTLPGYFEKASRRFVEPIMGRSFAALLAWIKALSGPEKIVRPDYRLAERFGAGRGTSGGFDRHAGRSGQAGREPGAPRLGRHQPLGDRD